MIRRLLARGLIGAAMALGVVAMSTSSVAAATQLLLPQGTAFAILGVSCGGIQEAVYATGFDATSGYPTGIVNLSTRCGGSGRGGGYKTTTYTASAGVTWDFTGAVVSSVSPAIAVTVNPTFSAYDSHGNHLYNSSGSAFLVLAAGFVPTARIASIAPASGPSSGGTTVTITGTGFTGVTKVNFGTVAAKSFTVASSTSMTAVSPVATAGTVDVTVLNGGGTSSIGASDRFTFVAAPAVSSVSPNTGSPAGGATVTITGSHLAGTTRVAFGGTAAGFTVNSDTSITAYTPAAQAAGTVDVRVTTIGGTSARVTADRYTYVVTRPVVSSISPSTGPQAGGTQVTITGSSLGGASEVDFGGVAASFWVNDDTSITAYAPTASTGTVDVTVVTFGVRSATSAADQFTYIDSTPTVTGVSPASGPAAGGTLVVITGTNLTNTLEVDFGGVAAPFAVIDDSSMYALSPGGSAGTVDVTVITDSGTSATNPADTFSYVPPPAVTGVSPASGSVDGGTEVTITGTDLAGAVEVDFGGVAASFTVNADGSITAVAPAGTAGTVDVTVTTDGGTSAPADQFTYV